ncbi:MAG: vWA domain-containing protein, partial [Bacteroidota bacterium]
MMKVISVFLLFCCCTLLSLPTIAQKKPEKTPKTTRILFLLDGSGSMRATWDGRQRIDIAREILLDITDSLTQQPNIEVALRVYGHQFDRRYQNCTDSKLEVSFAPNNYANVRSTLSRLTPQGVTPIAYSLEQATKDF